jgi:hypothetical protein
VQLIGYDWEKIMALVRKLERIILDRSATHDETDCTYSIVLGDNGERLLQVDTYGSKLRQMPGKKSQSIRFTQEALEQLKTILAEL